MMNEIMYNQIQKQKYLDSCKYNKGTRYTIMNMFRGAARVERHFGTDLANFNKPKVEELLKSYNSKSRDYLTSMCVYYADYFNWCLENAYVDPSNVINQYDSSMVKTIIENIVPFKLIKGKFFNKKDILKYLDCIEDVSNKFIMYALFIGIKGEDFHELSHLRMSSLDEEKRVVKLTDGRLRSVDDLFIDLMKKTDQSQFYYEEGKSYINNKRNIYDDSIYVLKYCRNNKNANLPVNRGFYSVRLKIIKRQTSNKFITAPTLYMNGLINFIKEQFEKKGITLEDAFFHKTNNKLYTYNDDIEKLITEYGANKTVRMLRYELKETLQFYM